MSMDYSDYMRIKTHSRWLGLVWIIGDCSYYIGLLGGIGLIAWSLGSTIIGGLAWLFGSDQSEHYLRRIPSLLALVPACVVVIFGAWWLKRFARRHSGLFQHEE